MVGEGSHSGPQVPQDRQVTQSHYEIPHQAKLGLDPCFLRDQGCGSPSYEILVEREPLPDVHQFSIDELG